MHVVQLDASGFTKAPRSEDTWGSMDVATRILKLAARWSYLVSCTPLG
jgi:hypothetical protein